MNHILKVKSWLNKKIKRIKLFISFIYLSIKICETNTNWMVSSDTLGSYVSFWIQTMFRFQMQNEQLIPGTT